MLRKITFPQWLDGQTIALLTLLAALGAMMQYGFADIRGEFRQLRGEMGSEIGQVRNEISQVRGEIGQVRGEIGQLRTEMRDEISELRTEFRSEFHRVEDRLQKVEMDVTAIKAGMGQATISEEVAAR